MSLIDELLENNHRWALNMQREEEHVLDQLVKGQDPKLLWIGCSDSRVLAINSLGLGPGDIFVHRNIANQARLDDPSCQSVLQYATTVLNVEHILVCGHYGCGGVAAAVQNAELGSDLDTCLLGLKTLCKAKAAEHSHDPDFEKRMVEENIRFQVQSVANSPHLKRAWEEGREIQIHGLVFDIATGFIENLNCTVSSPPESK